MAENILFPPGRMIGGNLDKLFPVFESDNKTPKLDKGGQPLMDCSIGFAIPKGPEAHMQIAPGQPPAWAHTPWGKVIYETGAAAHPNLVASPAFSWKIIDGDSAIPNKNGKKPCDKVGHPGHWVLWFSQGWLPKRVNSDGTVELPEGSIVPGYYIQVYGSVAGNKLVPNGTPGVYLNPIAVALVGEGDKIASDVDTTAVGFGGAPLPAGARPVSPVVPGMPAMTPPPVPPTPAAPVAAPTVPSGPVMTAAAGGQTYAAMIAAGWTDELLIQHGMMFPIAAVAPTPAVPVPPAAPAPVVPPAAPNMSFVPPPAPAPVVPPVPPVPPAAPARTMTAQAQGVTYEAFVAQGWTDAQLREQGMML